MSNPFEEATAEAARRLLQGFSSMNEGAGLIVPPSIADELAALGITEGYTVQRPLPNPTGFTEELRARCRDRCAFYGDPPCWIMPELTSDCEPITPCQDCIDNKPNPDEEEL